MPRTMRRPFSAVAWDLAPLAVVVSLCVFSAFPFAWMVFSSLKSYAALYRFPPSFSLTDLGFDNYRAVLISTPLLSFMQASTVVGLGATVIGTIVAALMAYALARSRSGYSKLLGRTLLLAYLFPPILIAVPLFVIVNRLGLANTWGGLIMVHTGYIFPFSTWMLIPFFKRIPMELEEAAGIDGAGHTAIFLRIVLPLVAPGLATVAIFGFITSWNEYLLSLIVLGSGDNRTLSVGLYSMVGGEFAQWGTVMAATTLAIIPTFFMFLAIQDRITGGLMAGAVKG
jgi:ABC-type glycerol-3-phosphate transport system permease component